ncbi:MAG: MATE family efflux transporter [Clostridia bacterium]|nr:MATE family efflux transporter [Clostridia bacterium]
MTNVRDMTRGSPTRLILTFSLPILATNALQQLYSLVDSLVVGNILGVTELSAVSSSGWLDWTVLSIAMGLAQGFAIQIAQSFGAKHHAELRRAVGQSLLIAAVTVVLLEAASQLLLRPVLTLMKAPAETIDMTEAYLRIIFAGLPLVMAVNVLGGFLRSVGDSRTPLIAMVFATVVNIGLDILFVSALHRVEGGAIATVCAQAVSALICFLAVRRMPLLHPSREDLRPDRAMCRRLLRLGGPIAFQNFVISVGGLVLQTVVNGYPFPFIAGYNTASRMQGLVEMAGGSLGGGVATFAGQNTGARRLDRVREGLRKSALIGLLLALTVGALIVIFGRQLLSLFMGSDERTLLLYDQVMQSGYRFLCVMAAGLPMLYLLFVYRSTLQGMGDTVIPMLSGFVELAMRIGMALLLPLLFHEWGVYIAEIAAWIGAAILLIIGCYRRLRRMEAGTEEA